MRLLFCRCVATFIFGASLLAVAGSNTSFADCSGGKYAQKSQFSSSSTTEINQSLPTNNGLMNFRASPLPEELQREVGSSDDFMLSLDMLFPNVPRTYDIKVNQEGVSGINSKIMSQTQPSTVKRTDISLQFNPKKLYSIDIKIEFEIEEETLSPEEPMKYSISGSPTMAQTIAPEGTSYCGSRLEKYSNTLSCCKESEKNCVYLPVPRSAMSTGVLFRGEK
jgi:hypothetical protein